MKRKSITFVLLVTMVMSWTSIAFAFMPANVIHNNSSNHLDSNVVEASQHCVEMAGDHTQQVVDEQGTPCQNDSSISKSMISQDYCQECITPQCHLSVYNIQLTQDQQFDFKSLFMISDRNFIYSTFHSSDFRQDILRPPQA